MNPDTIDTDDINEMLSFALMSKEAGFSRVQIDPDHLIQIIDQLNTYRDNYHKL